MSTSIIYTDRDCAIISGAQADSNYPSDPYLTFYTGANTLKAMIGFNISSAPSSADVSSVIYSGQSNQLGAHNVQVNRVTNDSWAESYPTWNNTSFTATNQLTGLNWPTSGNWTSYNVTDMYKDAKDAGMTIFGILLIHAASDINAVRTKEYGGANKSYITITYTESISAQINIGDTWKDMAAMKINIGDTWKDVVSIKQNIGDTWKTVL